MIIEEKDIEKSKPAVSEQKANIAKYGFIAGLLINGTGIILAVMSNSLVAVSDMVNGLTETLAIFMSWLAVKRASNGETHKFNYGQGKVENLASLGIVLALLISFGMICYNAVLRLQSPTMVNVSGVALYIVLIVIAFGSNTYFWLHAYRLSIIMPSPGIESQWRLFRVKAIGNAFVIISLSSSIVFRSYSWALYLDPAFSLGIAILILISAYKILTKSIYDLLDGALEENIQLMIMRELAVNFDMYSGFHGTRSRRVGNRVFIELFLEFEPERSMREVQQSIDRIKGNLEESIKGSQVMIIPATSPMD